MSDSERPPTSLALDTLIAEAKEHLDVRRDGVTTSKNGDVLADMDWSRLESRVMAAVEEEKPVVVRSDVGPKEAGRRGRAVGTAALVFAAAAAALVFVREHRHVVPTDVRSPSDESLSASSLRAAEGSGEVRIGGVVATPGQDLHAGDWIDANGARAVFERPRKVTWLLEPESTSDHPPPARARVKSAAEPLVLGLEHGAIEAQVMPVPVGEAFAVDVTTDRGVVRVAVHGTHLRVARSGNRVVVDLTEGVVSIGVPPRTGVTYGTLVTAPAHVELDATDLQTLRVDHTPASVRTAIPLGSYETAGTGAQRHEDPSASMPIAMPSSAIAKGASSHPYAAKTEPPKVALPAREAIAAAVRDCAAGRARPSDVRVTVTSNLRLRVSGSGVVESAQFAPPLLPEIQSCAAEVIYRTKLDEIGMVTIPIEYSY